MPRYRFSWSNIDDRLLVALCENEARDPDDAAAQLRGWYGMRPNELFVQQCWIPLREDWLAQSSTSRRAVVSRLLELGLATGGRDRRPRSREGELHYLRECRNTRRMREVILEEFIRSGEGPRVRAVPADEVPELEYRAFRKVEPPGDDATDTFRPFDFQVAAWTALSESRPIRGGLLVLPTGAGKTVTAVRWLLAHVLCGDQPRPVLWLAHRAELLEQAADTFEESRPALRLAQPITIRCVSGVHGNPAHTIIQPADVNAATMQTLARSEPAVEEYFRRYPNAFVVIDEAHHAAAKSYRRILDIARRSPDVEWLGLTATPTRTSQDELGLLAHQFPAGVIYQVEPARLISEGILARPICESVPTGCDFDRELTADELRYLERYGDISPTTLQRIAAATARNSLITSRYLRFREQYRQTLVFAANIAHCYTLAQEFSDRGIRAGYVASVRDDDRANEAVLQEFRDQALDVLVSVTKLTEGIDLPLTGTIFLARPTGSRILLSQMIGRGMRGPKVGGKTDVRVVSFEDHWIRFRDWLDPIRFVDGAIADDPDSPQVRPDMVPVPWDLYLDIARMTRAIGTDGKPDAIFVPAGWYTLFGDDNDATPKHVLVYEHQRDGFDLLIRSAVNSNETADPPSLLDQYFDDCADPRPSELSLLAVWDHTRLVGAPELITFDDAERFDPAHIAATLTDQTMNEAIDGARHVFASTMARVLYPSERSYIDAILAAVADVQLGRSVGSCVVTPLATRENLPALTSASITDRDLKNIAAGLTARMRLSKNPPPIRWSKKPLSSVWGFCRDTPREIVINATLNTRDIRPETLACLVYHELLHHELETTGHQDPFAEWEHRFPGWLDAWAELDTLAERFAVDRTAR